jgi:hypothetical protein
MRTFQTLARPLFLALALAISSVGPAVATDPPDYPLVCSFDGSTSAAMIQEPTGYVGLLRFRHATRPATAGVEPGTCAWRDRAVRDTEPHFLEQAVHESTWTIEPRGGQVVMWPGTDWGGFGMPWLSHLGERGFTITCMVHAVPTGRFAYPALEASSCNHG